MEHQISFSLRGKTALVTGCSTGLGKDMAIALAGAGADIIGIARNLEDSEVEQQVTATGATFRKYSCDISNRTELYDCIRNVKAENPRVDILVNNAGTILRKPAAEHPDDYWDKVVDTNLNAQFILAREFGREMVARGSGKMVFTCSMLSYQGGINVPGYTASKSAVAGLVRAFANEWAARGVNVNGIAPGYIATNNTEALRADANRNRAILDRIPAARWGTPGDLRGPVVFLCSSAADYIHGTILNVDGGWMAR